MSKKQKLTPWFDGRITPRRTGVYEVEWDGVGIRRYALWEERPCHDGIDGWRCSIGDDGSLALTPDQAMRPDLDPACYRPRRWRGLAEDPNA